MPRESSRDTTSLILQKLLKAGSEFISGNDIASELNMSRVSIWSHLEKLRKDGFEFEAIRNRGYRISKLPRGIHEDLLKAYLQVQGVGSPFHFHEEIDSTNTEAERLISSGAPTPFSVIAKRMTQGRGRRGRSWHGGTEGNLYLTFGFKPKLSPSKIHVFGLWVATTLCAFLKENYSVDAQVKWPNDILVGGKKISGMLTEARVDADHIRDLIFGIGINVNGSTDAWPEELTSKATTLEKAKGEPWNINRLGMEVIDTILSTYAQFESGGLEGKLQAMWDDYDFLRDKKICAHQNNQAINGTSAGINEDGQLIIKETSGKETALHSGDVTLEQMYK